MSKHAVRVIISLTAIFIQRVIAYPVPDYGQNENRRSKRGLFGDPAWLTLAKLFFGIVQDVFELFTKQLFSPEEDNSDGDGEGEPDVEEE